MSSGSGDGDVAVINFVGKPRSLSLRASSFHFLSGSRISPPLVAAGGSAAGVSSLICSQVLSPACPCNLTAGRLALQLLSACDFLLLL